MATESGTEQSFSAGMEKGEDGGARPARTWTWVVLGLLALGVAGLGALTDSKLLLGAGALATGLCLIVFNKPFGQRTPIDYDIIDVLPSERARRIATVVLGVVAAAAGAVILLGTVV